MSAGLPGLGLGGVFFILSALIAPAVEVVRWTRGQSSAETRRTVARQFALALVMVVAVDLTLRGSLLVLAMLGLAEAPQLGLVALPLAPLGMTVTLMLAVLGLAKGLEVLHRRRVSRRARDRRLREPLRAEA
jgi:hypothetical protein